MNWIFSDENTSAISELNCSIQKKTIENANGVLGQKYSSYSPWMCNLKSLDELKDLFSNDEFLIKDDKVLKKLSKHYFLNRKGIANVYPGAIEESRYAFYEEALKLLKSVPTIKSLFDELVLHLVPLNPEKDSIQPQGAGSSNLLARGAIFMSVPYMDDLTRIQLAINLAHEVGHQTLMVYQTANRIFKDDLSEPAYSYILKRDRPIIMSFHATMALAFMTEFLEKVDKNLLTDKEKTFVESELQTIRADFVGSLDEYKKDQFTFFGSMLFKELLVYAKAA